jgi:DNA-directed RNA polymerase subunit RPC12/RpoP
MTEDKKECTPWGEVRGLRVERERLRIEDLDKLTICDICGNIFHWDKAQIRKYDSRSCPACGSEVLQEDN